MLKNKQIQAVRQVDKVLKNISFQQIPLNGYINNIRRLVNMSMSQLGKRLNLSSQGVYAMEKREKEGAITLQKLKEVANAFDMELVYSFVPRTSLEAMIEAKASAKAEEIIRRSNQNMHLEDQQVDGHALKEQKEALKEDLKANLSSLLWD